MDLNFENCSIGDGGARAVAEHLPKELTSLKLDFDQQEAYLCQIGEEGARAIAEHLPKKLISLDVVIGRCKSGKEVAQSVADIVPPRLRNGFCYYEDDDDING